MASRTTPFKQEFIEQCFVAWVGAGCPEDISPNIHVFPTADDGRTPDPKTILYWRRKYNWRERADSIQEDAIELVRNEIVLQKADLLREQFQKAMAVYQVAFDYIVSGTFDSSASAVGAIKWASEEARRAVGISEIIEKMAKMTDSELEKEILDRIRRATEAGQIIEGEVTDTGDTE